MNYLNEWYGTSRRRVGGRRTDVPRRVYMFGDSPDSGRITFVRSHSSLDIRGANEYGWYSILVRTGNFKGPGNSRSYPAKRVFDDVEEAVEWIVGHEDRRYQNFIKAQEKRQDVEEKDGDYYAE